MSVTSDASLRPYHYEGMRASGHMGCADQGRCRTTKGGGSHREGNVDGEDLDLKAAKGTV